MSSSNGNISRITGHLCGEFTITVAHAPGMPGTFSRHGGSAIPTCITKYIYMIGGAAVLMAASENWAASLNLIFANQGRRVRVGELEISQHQKQST